MWGLVGSRGVGCSITVVKNNPTNCATTRGTTTNNLSAILFRGGTLNNIYLGRKYIPAGALLCSTGIFSAVGRTPGCTMDTRGPTFSFPGVVTHGGGIMGGLATNVHVGVGRGNIRIIDNRTRVGKQTTSKAVAVTSNRTICRTTGLLVYANSRAIVPPVPKLTRARC